MKIELPQVIQDSSSKITGTTTLAAADNIRKDCIITALTAGPFYVKRGSGASSSNFTWLLNTAGQTITIENYNGIITVDADPSGNINVAIGKVGSVQNIPS